MGRRYLRGSFAARRPAPLSRGPADDTMTVSHPPERRAVTNFPAMSRREALKAAACGFGYLALAGLEARRAGAAGAARGPHFTPKAKRVIFLFMQGGVSHVDSYDYKPRLYKDDGKRLSFDDARVIANTGTRGSSQRVMRPLWKFAKYGACGRWASELFPNVNRHVDELCFVHSLHTEGVAHGPATLFLHCGSTNFVRPSMGSWVLYGLGSENENLPGFVSIAPSSGNGGPRNYGSPLPPAVCQGTAVGKAGGPARDLAIRNLSNGRLSRAEQRRQLDLLAAINAEQLKRSPGEGELEAVARSYELGWRMQTGAPDVLD